MSALPDTLPTAIPTLSDVLAVLGDHGYRLTGPRRSVLAAVLRHARPFTAEQLVAEVRASHPGIGRATVYRTLDILVSVDVLRRLLQPGRHPSYVVGAPTHRHHLVCSGCGTVVPFTRCPVDELVRSLSRDTDFAIHSHTLEVFGTCRDCRNQTGMPAARAATAS